MAAAVARRRFEAHKAALLTATARAAKTAMDGVISVSAQPRPDPSVGSSHDGSSIDSAQITETIEHARAAVSISDENLWIHKFGTRCHD
eukprot:SAG31_NODE_21_length_34109_cov_60.598824_33_plen_89_part_00